MPARSAKHDIRDLTDLHLLILSALWATDESTIAEIHAAIGAEAEVSVKTVATLLTRLEGRRLVKHRMAGREGVYRATISRREALVLRAGKMLSAFFAADDASIGPAAVRKAETANGDAAKLLELLRRAERDVKGG